MAKIFLVVPDAPMEEVAQLKSNRTLGGRGIRLGILDNSKANADHLLDLIIEGVKKEYKVDSVVGTPASMAERLADATAIPRSLPAFTCGAEVDT